MEDLTVKYYGFCYRCYTLFKTASVAHRGLYAQCPYCQSQTDNWHEDSEEVIKNIKRLAMCPRCKHLWFLKKQNQVKNKKNYYAQCPACKTHKRRRIFFMHFKNMYWDYYEYTKDMIIKKFPRGHVRILKNYLTKEQFDERIRDSLKNMATKDTLY